MYYGYRFYLCCFYYFSVRFWNCSDSVVFVVFLLDFRIVLTVWYLVVFLLDFRIVPPVWYCFVFHCFTEMLINNCIHLISQSICQCQDNAHIITTMLNLIPKVKYIEHQRTEEQIDHNIYSVLRFTDSD
jgi:hypothetical protein